MLVSYKDATQCFYCGLPFNSKFHHNNAGNKTKDHIIPLSKGGCGFSFNIVASCSWCNNLKHSDSLEQFELRIISLGEIGRFNRDKNVILKNIKLLKRHVINKGLRMYRNYYPHIYNNNPKTQPLI